MTELKKSDSALEKPSNTIENLDKDARELSKDELDTISCDTEDRPFCGSTAYYYG